jgi:hypothetical protein
LSISYDVRLGSRDLPGYKLSGWQHALLRMFLQTLILPPSDHKATKRSGKDHHPGRQFSEGEHHKQDGSQGKIGGRQHGRRPQRVVERAEER